MLIVKSDSLQVLDLLRWKGPPNSGQKKPVGSNDSKEEWTMRWPFCCQSFWSKILPARKTFRPSQVLKLFTSKFPQLHTTSSSRQMPLNSSRLRFPKICWCTPSTILVIPFSQRRFRVSSICSLSNSYASNQAVSSL